MTYAHWITFLIRKAAIVIPLEKMAEYTGATIEFPPYNMTQMLRHSIARTPSQPRRRPEVPETAAQQDEIISGVAAIEEQLDAQQEGVIESDPSDSSDDDYQAIP